MTLLLPETYFPDLVASEDSSSGSPQASPGTSKLNIKEI